MELQPAPNGRLPGPPLLQRPARLRPRPPYPPPPFFLASLIPPIPPPPTSPLGSHQQKEWKTSSYFLSMFWCGWVGTLKHLLLAGATSAPPPSLVRSFPMPLISVFFSRSLARTHIRPSSQGGMCCRQLFNGYFNPKSDNSSWL
jgi:hypothetical protein